jgi:hypothetical protein
VRLALVLPFAFLAGFLPGERREPDDCISTNFPAGEMTQIIQHYFAAFTASLVELHS